MKWMISTLAFELLMKEGNSDKINNLSTFQGLLSFVRISGHSPYNSRLIRSWEAVIEIEWVQGGNYGSSLSITLKFYLCFE